MTDQPTRRRTRLGLVAVLAIASLVALACDPSPPVAPARGGGSAVAQASLAGPIMGPSRLSAAQLTAWFESRDITGARPTVPVATLARLFIEEGNREGVAGDVAFVQSIVETGWFRFSTRVPPSRNNFAGIGAVDGGTSSASFPSARIGVRAQIQHLRAYADRRVNCSNFATPTVTPRCRLVVPKGRTTTWAEMGNGNWATDPGYAGKIERLYDEALDHALVK